MTRRNLAAGLSVLTAVALCSLASPGGSAFAEESEPDDTQTPNAIPWDVAPHIDEQTVPSPDAPDGEWQAAVNAAIDEIREEWPDDFGYGAILEPGAAEVRFAGAVPPSLPAVEGLAYVSDLGYTEIQAHEFALNAAEAAWAATPDGASSVMQYLPIEGRVEIIVSDAEIVPVLEGQQAAARQPAALPLSVDVTYSATLGEFQSEAMGAGAATRRAAGPDAGQVVCSTAFPVLASGGRQGVLSAGHCPSRVDYWQPGWNIFALTHDNPAYSWVSSGAGQPNGVGGDGRWYWSNQAFSGETYTGLNHRRFASTGSANVGSSVCRYGVSTGYHCGTVRTNFGSINSQVCYDVDNYVDCVGQRVYPVTCTSVHDSAVGDSGGPWFLNYQAFGVHAGGDSSVGSCYTPVARLLGRFQLSLLS